MLQIGSSASKSVCYNSFVRHLAATNQAAEKPVATGDRVFDSGIVSQMCDVAAREAALPP